jgi:hypothetical protein
VHILNSHANRADDGRTLSEPGVDPLQAQDDRFLAEARRWYAQQSQAVREWPLGLADEPDFVRALADEK